MNWEAIGAIGEIVGALAVVVSLIYLATQIRVQNREARIAAVHDVVMGQRQSMQLFLEPGMAKDFLTVLSDFDGAEPSQRLRFTMLVMDVWKLSQDAYLQNLEGRIDDGVWNGFNLQLADLMSNKPCWLVWESRKHQFDHRFQRFMHDLTPGTPLFGGTIKEKHSERE
jgi:hypothetical protein